jgi:hypothetical protein
LKNERKDLEIDRSSYGYIRRRKPKENLSVEGDKKMKYRVHRFDLKMTSDQSKLEQFLNSLDGEVVAIIPNVTWAPKVQVDFLLIVEKLG